MRAGCGKSARPVRRGASRSLLAYSTGTLSPEEEGLVVDFGGVDENSAVCLIRRYRFGNSCLCTSFNGHVRHESSGYRERHCEALRMDQPSCVCLPRREG